jgi:hypothetical protein
MGMIYSLRHPIREHFVPKAALALDLFLWLWSLPVLVRIYSVPRLLQRLSHRTKSKRKPISEPEVIGVVTRVCNLRPFRSRIFPKQCLRQSLCLYRALIALGYPVQIHFGVRKDESELTGHCWVTENGTPVGDTAYGETFKVVYSYASSETPDAMTNRRMADL